MINTKNFVKSTLLASSLVISFSACRSRSTSEDVPYVRTHNYKHAELIIKDYDEMQTMVQSLIRKAHASGDDAVAVEHLQSALKLVLSRPDSDDMVSKLTNDVRRELNGYGSFERVVAQLAAESIDNLRNPENTLGVRTTASFILENLLAEIRLASERENGEMRKTMQRIADSDAELPRDVRTERTLRGMYRAPNPNEEARRILKAIAEHEKAEKTRLEKAAERARTEAKKNKK